MSSSARRFRGLLLLTWLVLTAGCSNFNMNRRIPWRADTSDGPRQANKILATWTDSISSNPDRPPRRGFGGRLMFFEDGDDKPVKVKGDLVVYAFDEEGRKPSDTKPDRKYVFPAETLEHYYSKSKIGHSYSVWLPWDEAGGPKKEIGLIARLVPKEGPAVVSHQSKIVLSGTESASSDQYTFPVNQNPPLGTSQEGVQAVRYDQSARVTTRRWPGVQYASGDSPPANRMKTTTIDIQPNFGRRMPAAQMQSRHDLARSKGPSIPESTTLAKADSHPKRSARFSLSRSRSPGEPITRPSHDHARWPARPVGWRSQPQSGNSPSAE